MTDRAPRARRMARSMLRTLLECMSAAGLGCWCCPQPTLELIALQHDLEHLDDEVERILREAARTDTPGLP